MDTRQPYPSDLTDAEWAQVCRFVPAPKPGGRPAKHTRREIVNGLLYLARTGCQWRALPHDLPPWGTVQWYFRLWKADGTFDRLMAERYDFEQRKGYAKSADGWSRDLWAQYAELGLLALPFAEEHGGFGGGPAATMIVLEALGRALERHRALDHLAEVALGLEAQLDVHVGEAEIAVEQQRVLAHACQRVRQRDGEPRLADAALAAGHGDDVAPAQGPHVGAGGDGRGGREYLFGHGAVLDELTA